jgi:hypothetical protein
MLELGKPMRIALGVVGPMVSVDVMSHLVKKNIEKVELPQARLVKSEHSAALPVRGERRTELGVLDRHAGLKLSG